MRPIDRIIVHHSGSPGGSAEFFRRVHVDEFEWDDIGYHRVICNGVSWGGYPAPPDGTVQPGRSLEEVGAHCRGYNRTSIGICLVGDFESQWLTPAQMEALIPLLERLCGQYGIDPASSIHGHGELLDTSCPGANMAQLLPKIRATVARRLSGGAPGMKPRRTRKERP